MANGALATKHDAAGATAEGLGLAATLSWLLAVPFCPAQVAAALPPRCAAPFIGAFMFGCALYCVAAACISPHRPSRRRMPHRILALLLTLGVGLETSLCALGLLGSLGSVFLSGTLSLVAGLGEGAALLAWGQKLAARPVDRMVGTVSVACGGTAATTVLLGLLAFSPAALLMLLFAIAVASSVGAFLPCRRTPQNAIRATEKTRMSDVRRTVIAPVAGRLWEPVLGLGLSLMSAVLPWGSLISDDSVSIPAFWSFAVGAALVTLALPWVARLVRSRVDYGVAIHVAIPLLAAAVVGLRMVGDLEEANPGFAVLKGIGSGVAGAGFLACALIAMAHEARTQGPARSDVPFALGFGGACLVGFAILPAHAASQSAASLVAPFLSLAFLATSCCSSVVHIRRHAEEARRSDGASIGIEEAASIVARQNGLSPREAQVLSQLVLGRSAASIGEVLGISPNTVRSHVSNIHGKLGIQSRDQLADLIERTRRASAGTAGNDGDTVGSGTVLTGRHTSSDA